MEVGAAAAAPCVKSLRSSSSNSYVVSHPAERALWRACKPCWNVGERPSRTSSSSYVVANTGRIVSSKLSSMQLPTESAGATAEPVLLSDGKRHCGVGGWSGGRPGASWSWRIQIRAITSPPRGYNKSHRVDGGDDVELESWQHADQPMPMQHRRRVQYANHSRKLE